MKNTNILKEINEMKYLFDYKRGKVISEQNINEEGDVNDFVTGGKVEVSVGDPTTTTTSSATTSKTTRRGTAIEVQKLLNTKFGAGLKEDSKVGPLTLGAVLNALEGSSGSSTGVSVTPTTTVAGGSTTTTTTVAGSTASTPTTPTSGGIDTSNVGGDATGLIG